MGCENSLKLTCTFKEYALCEIHVTRTSRRIYSNAAAQSGVGELDFRLQFMCCKQTFMQRTMMHIGEFGGMAPRRSDPLKKLAYKSIIPQ